MPLPPGLLRSVVRRDDLARRNELGVSSALPESSRRAAASRASSILASSNGVQSRRSSTNRNHVVVERIVLRANPDQSGVSGYQVSGRGAVNKT